MARVTYSAARLEWATRFAYSPEVARLLRRFAGVRPEMCVVELGCGTGFWGRLLAAGLDGRGSLIGIDLDAGLLRRARQHARAEGLALARYDARSRDRRESSRRRGDDASYVQVTYRVGDATRTRLPSASADLVTCHRLLCVVPDPAAVVREMARLTRPGGRVVANEHDHTADIFWEPDDPKLAALADRRNDAWVRGSRKTYGGDHGIGSRVAELFLDAGLRDVRIEGVLAPSGPQPFDARVPDDELRSFFAWLEGDLARPDPFRQKVYRAGGWSLRSERAYLTRARAAIARRLADGDLRRWGRVNLVPRVVVRGSAPGRHRSSVAEAP